MQNVCLSIQINYQSLIKDLKGFFVKGCKDSQDKKNKVAKEKKNLSVSF